MDSAIFRARILALILVVVTALFFLDFAISWRQQPLFDGLSRLTSNSWSTAITIDFLIGTVFHAIYLWLLNGPSFCFIPCRVLSILTPILGNFVPLLYVAYLLFNTRASSIASVLLPFSSSSSSSINAYNKTTIRCATAVFTIALATLFGVCAWAAWSMPEDLTTVLNKAPWAMTTVADNFAGMCLTIAIIIAREESFVVSQLMWIVARLMLWNGSTCLYVLAVASQAQSKRIGFASCLLTQRRLLPGLPQEEPLLAPHH